MADSKISALTSVSSVAAANEFPLNEAGTTKKASGTLVTEFVESRLQHGVLCTHASDQTATNNTWTTLAFDTETWKVGDSAIHSTVTNNSRLTAQVAGQYVVTAVVGVEAVAASFLVQARILRNGTEIFRNTINSLNNATYPTRAWVPSTVHLAASQFLDLQVWHNRGSDLDALLTDTYFGMYLLGR